MNRHYRWPGGLWRVPSKRQKKRVASHETFVDYSLEAFKLLLSIELQDTTGT